MSVPQVIVSRAADNGKTDNKMILYNIIFFFFLQFKLCLIEIKK